VSSSLLCSAQHRLCDHAHARRTLYLDRMGIGRASTSALGGVARCTVQKRAPSSLPCTCCSRNAFIPLARNEPARLGWGLARRLCSPQHFANGGGTVFSHHYHSKRRPPARRGGPPGQRRRLTSWHLGVPTAMHAAAVAPGNGQGCTPPHTATSLVP
jgi:hypothetical protein